MSETNEKARVCFVLPSLAPGGTERQLLYLIRRLRDTHECTVVCTRTGGAWADSARESGARVFELRSWGGWDMRIGRRAGEVFRSVRPEIVHTFLYGFDLPVNRAARGAGVPVVVSSRRELAAWMKPRHLRVQRRANAFVDCIVANSRAVAAFAAAQEELDANRIRVVYNGIDTEIFVAESDREDTRRRLGIPENRHVVGMVANFSPVKDHMLFLQAARVLIQNSPHIHFLLVGSGPLQRQVEGAIRDESMQEVFTITSTTDNSANILRAMDVCALTSQREGFPNAILEAMALGLPVVAAAVGGVPELVDDGESGLLVSSREPGAFAAAIARCLDDSAMAKALGDCARERVQREFSADRMVESYRAIYLELLARAIGAG